MTQNDDIRDDELLARYRQAGETDAVTPSNAVREAILAESRRVAAQLAKQAPQHTFDVSRPAANDSRWKVMAFGTAGAALLAALLFAPRYWENTSPAQVSTAPTRASAPATQAEAKVDAPKFEDITAASNTAPARQSASDSTSLQEIVVTQAERKRSKSTGAPSPNIGAPAPTLPPSVAQNYAPASPSPSPFAGAPPAPAARVRRPDAAAQVAESNSILTSADHFVGGAVQKPVTLESAVAHGDVAQTASLLDRGAVIDGRDEAGRTALMLAVTQDRLEIVRLLLARGADPNAADNAGHTPLQQATKRNLQDVAALLEQAGAH
jgi:ankyrin repeat protein